MSFIPYFENYFFGKWQFFISSEKSFSKLIVSYDDVTFSLEIFPGHGFYSKIGNGSEKVKNYISKSLASSRLSLLGKKVPSYPIICKMFVAIIII
jgi:hypothetical protein